MVNVFEAVKSTVEYLTATNVAADQIQKTSLTPAGAFTIEFPLDEQYVKTGGEVSPFLIEGCAPGSGDLTLIVKKDGTEISRKPAGRRRRRSCRRRTPSVPGNAPCPSLNDSA